jgi:hypothetical protein
VANDSISLKDRKRADDGDSYPSADANPSATLRMSPLAAPDDVPAMSANAFASPNGPSGSSPARCSARDEVLPQRRAFIPGDAHAVIDEPLHDVIDRRPIRRQDSGQVVAVNAGLEKGKNSTLERLGIAHRG